MGLNDYLEDITFDGTLQEELEEEFGKADAKEMMRLISNGYTVDNAIQTVISK